MVRPTPKMSFYANYSGWNEHMPDRKYPKVIGRPQWQTTTV